MNQQDDKADVKAEAVEDLELTDQKAEDTKAGSGGEYNLGAFAGQTVRLRIASTNNQGKL